MTGNEALPSAYRAIPQIGDSQMHEHGTPVTPEFATPTPLPSPMDQNAIAYELLLLQQRLSAYERLHQEEIGELRREIERLSRAFLHQPHTPPPHTPSR